MQFIQVNTVFLLILLLLQNTKADLRHCADFDPDIDVEKFSYQNELEQLLGNFNGTHFEQTGELFQLLQRIESNEIDNTNYISSSKLVNYVVSLEI